MKRLKTVNAAASTPEMLTAYVLLVALWSSILCAATGAGSASARRTRGQTTPAMRTIYVATNGDDGWSGGLPTPIRDKRDGPLRTIERARDLIRTRKREGRHTQPITVYVRGGTYFLDQPLIFTAEDSGTPHAPVTYAAYPNEQPVISGGLEIKDWKQQGKLWTAQVSGVRDKAISYFRQLWINGERRFRARTPDEDYHRIAELPGVDFTVNVRKSPSDNFRFAPGEIRSTWTNLTDVEVVLLYFWTDAHLPIAKVHDANRTVTFTRKTRRRMTEDFTRRPARYFVDNVFEGLDTPGEWYLNRQTETLYYLPRPGERRERVHVVAPRLPMLVRFDGAPEANRFVEHIKLKGLTFSHNEWALPADGGDAGDLQAAVGVPGAISARGMRYCTLEENRIKNFGSYGIPSAIESDITTSHTSTIPASPPAGSGATSRASAATISSSTTTSTTSDKAFCLTWAASTCSDRHRVRSCATTSYMT